MIHIIMIQNFLKEQRKVLSRGYLKNGEIIKALTQVGAFVLGGCMKTKYNTGDEVLVPVIIRSALKTDGEIVYTIKDISDYSKEANILLPEGLIEGKAKIGKERYYKKRWEKRKKQ